MPELLLELFSEEIPARMQTRAAADLARLLTDALAPLTPAAVQSFAGPRRIAFCATLAPEQPGQSLSERGPRITAPDAALAGFLRKHAATRDQLAAEGDFLRHASDGHTLPIFDKQVQGHTDQYALKFVKPR